MLEGGGGGGGGDPQAGGRAALRDSLRRCFGGVREREAAWQKTLAACTPLLASLGNLAEQMRAAAQVAFEESPLRPFPDLPGRLGRKQRAAVEALLAELRHDKLQELQRVRDAAAAARASGLSLLPEAVGGESGRGGAFLRSACGPSLADMLEWLVDIEAFYHRVYVEVKLLLLPVGGESLLALQALPAAWAPVLQRGQQSGVEDVLLKVSPFLDAS